jgi:hypothetical protein
MSILNNIIDKGPMNRTRRNHAVEHATMHILAKKEEGQFLGGHSDSRGITIIGNVSTEDVQQAIEEAIQRLHAGETRLAIHPNCGTNFVASGFLAGIGAWVAMLGNPKGLRAKIDRLPLVMTLVTMVLIFSRPVGPMLQQYLTTNPDIGDFKVYQIMRHDYKNFVVHRILTQ